MTRLTIAACIAALVATAGMAIAQERVAIHVAGETVAFIRTGGPHGTLTQRQARIDQRVVQALSNERHRIFVQEVGGPVIDVVQVDGIWTVRIGNTMLIQAFPEDAAGAGTTPKALAFQWKENFARQLPRACSPIHVPAWWTDPHAEEAGPVTGQREHGMPTEDLPLVREVAEILNFARDTSDEEFEEMLPWMERALLATVWTYRHPNCGPAPINSHIRASSVLKRAKGLEEPQYRYERYWLAGVTVNRLREAMDMPEGVGPIPEQRDLPNFEAPAGPEEGPVAPDPAETAPVAVEPEPAPRTEPAPAPVETQPAATEATQPADEAFAAPIERVAIGTGLGADNTLLNAGRQFAAGTSQLAVYLKTAAAPNNTIVGVIVQKDDGIVARRLVRVSGDRHLAVTFAPCAAAGSFADGAYDLRLTVNGRDAGLVPFRIGTE